MKTVKKRNAFRTAAFVFALLTASTGMAGAYAGAGTDSMFSISASAETEENFYVTYKYYFKGSWTVKGQRISDKTTACLYESDKPDDWKTNEELCSMMGWVSCEGDLFYERETNGIVVNGQDFALNSGDNVILYSVRKNQYGNLEEKKLASFGASDENVIPIPSENETIYAKRYTRTGTESGVKTAIDNYMLTYNADSAESEWQYLGAFDWKNTYNEDSENFKTVSITKETFQLTPYTYANGSPSSVKIYSTDLNGNGENTLIAELNGNDDYNLSVLFSKNKNTGYIAVRTQGGNSLDSYYQVVSLYRYTDSGEWESFYASGKNVAPTILTLFPKESTFPMLQGLDVQELRIYNGDNVKVIDRETFYRGSGGVDFKLSAESTGIGLCYGNEYQNCRWEADVISQFASSKSQTTKDTTISGKFFANVPYVTEAVSAAEAYEELVPELPEAIADEEGTKFLPELPPPAYDEEDTDNNFRAVSISAVDAYAIRGNSEYEELEAGEHGNVYLMKGTEIIDSYTAQEFDKAAFTIPEFDKNSDYFLKVAHADDTFNDYYTYYKWDEDAGKWKFRVNNEATPAVSVPITHAEFTPYMDSDFTAELNLVSGNVSTTISTWTKKDFDEGNIKAMLMLMNAGEYQLTFRTENGSYDTYQYVGIDPVSIDYSIKPEDLKVYYFNTGYIIGCPSPYVDIPVLEVNPITNAEKGDTISIDGTAADGNAVHYELTQEWSNDTVNLPEGEYTITDTTAKYKADVAVSRNAEGLLQAQVTDRSSVDDRYVNVTVPVEVNDYTVSALNGKTLDSGYMKGKSLEVSDLNISADELKKETAYATFTAESGIINSVSGGAMTEVTENGYLAVANDEIQKLTFENAEKGDVNLDGKVNVTDAVMLQKYLLNKQSCQAENFINADMNQDGKVNVFDLALLKRKLLKK